MQHPLYMPKLGKICLVPTVANQVMAQYIAMHYMAPPTSMVSAIPYVGIPCIKKTSEKTIQNKWWHLTSSPFDGVNHVLDLVVVDVTSEV